jgi:hypothetical protein
MRALPRDVRNVHDHLLGAVQTEYLAAGTLPETTARLARSMAGRLQFLASVPQRILSGSPISRITPLLEVSLSSFRQKYPRGALKIGAGLVKGGGRAILLLAWVRSRIETTMLCPRILIMGVASADGDRAGVDIAVVDVGGG